MATTRQINYRFGSRDVIGLATQDGVTVHVPAGRVDNDWAGNVDDSSINGLPEDVVGRNPQVGPVVTDENQRSRCDGRGLGRRCITKYSCRG